MKPWMNKADSKFGLAVFGLMVAAFVMIYLLVVAPPWIPITLFVLMVLGVFFYLVFSALLGDDNDSS